MKMGVETFKAIRVVVEKGVGKDLNVGYFMIFENEWEMGLVKKILDKLKDGYWDAIKISNYYFIEHSVSQKTALHKIPNAIWVWKVNKYGKVEDMDWNDVDQLMYMLQEEYKKLSKPEPERRYYVITT